MTHESAIRSLHTADRSRDLNRARRQSGHLTPDEVRAAAPPPAIQAAPTGTQDSVSLGPSESKGPSSIGPLKAGLAQNYGLPEVSGIDSHKGVQQSGGDAKQYQGRLRGFGSRSEHMEPINDALKSGDTKKVAALAKTTHGKAEDIGADEVAERALDVAGQARTQDPLLGQSLDKLDRALGQTSSAISTLASAQ